MHRSRLLQLLQDYFPKDIIEQKFKVEIIDFVTHNTDCFERSLEDGHITASA